MEIELPAKLEDAHIIVHLDDLEPGRYLDESLNWLLAGDDRSLGPDYGYTAVRNSKGGLDTVNPETRKPFALTFTWVRGVTERYGYPRFHLIPSYVRYAQVNGEWVMGITLSGHIDKEEHLTDYSAEAYDKVRSHLNGLQERFRERLGARVNS